MYNYYQNNLALSLCPIFIRNCEILGHYTSRRNDPRVVAHRTDLIRKHFSCQRPELWRQPQSNAKERKYVPSLKRQLKR